MQDKEGNMWEPNDRNLFLGRESELERLKQLWPEVKAGKPSYVGIIAESGFGKTRLVQEFYGWLSTHEDGLLEKGYWPDQLDKTGGQLDIVPQPSGCNASPDITLPWLWMGFRTSAPKDRSQMASVAVGQIYSLFRPHLLNYSDRLSATLNEKQQFKTLLRELGDGSVDLALTAIGADAAIGVAKTTLKMGGAVRSYLNQRNLAGEAGSLDFDLNLKEAGEYRRGFHL